MNTSTAWQAQVTGEGDWRCVVSYNFYHIRHNNITPSTTCTPANNPSPKTPRFNKFRHALTNVGANGKPKSIKLLFSSLHIATYTNTRWGVAEMGVGRVRE
jgi:hypothetical protein